MIAEKLFTETYSISANISIYETFQLKIYMEEIYNIEATKNGEDWEIVATYSSTQLSPFDLENYNPWIATQEAKSFIRIHKDKWHSVRLVTTFKPIIETGNLNEDFINKHPFLKNNYAS